MSLTQKEKIVIGILMTSSSSIYRPIQSHTILDKTSQEERKILRSKKAINPILGNLNRKNYVILGKTKNETETVQLTKEGALAYIK